MLGFLVGNKGGSGNEFRLPGISDLCLLHFSTIRLWVKFTESPISYVVIIMMLIIFDARINGSGHNALCMVLS